jgi:hypothetical protein
LLIALFLVYDCCNTALCGLQVVVDSDAVGMELVRLLNKSGRGRVTFMPLNRLQVPDVAYPRQWGRDVEPLHKYMKCQDKYAKAVQQVCEQLRLVELVVCWLVVVYMLVHSNHLDSLRSLHMCIRVIRYFHMYNACLPACLYAHRDHTPATTSLSLAANVPAACCFVR